MGMRGGYCTISPSKRTLGFGGFIEDLMSFEAQLMCSEMLTRKAEVMRN